LDFSNVLGFGHDEGHYSLTVYSLKYLVIVYENVPISLISTSNSSPGHPDLGDKPGPRPLQLYPSSPLVGWLGFHLCLGVDLEPLSENLTGLHNRAQPERSDWLVLNGQNPQYEIVC